MPPPPHQPGDAISAAFSLYRRFPWLFFVLASGVLVPWDLIVLAVTGDGPYSSDSYNAAQIVVTAAEWIVIGPLVSALHVHAVADVRDGKEPQVGPVARRGLQVLPVVAAATIMSSLGIFLGILALIVPGVILFFRWFVVAQAAAIEKGSWLDALRRSRELTRENYGHIFVFFLLLAVIAGIPNLIGVAIAAGDTTVLTFIVTVVIHLFAVSFAALATAVLYFHLVERERARPSEAAAPSPPPPAAP